MNMGYRLFFRMRIGSGTPSLSADGYRPFVIHVFDICHGGFCCVVAVDVDSIYMQAVEILHASNAMSGKNNLEFGKEKREKQNAK